MIAESQHTALVFALEAARARTRLRLPDDATSAAIDIHLGTALQSSPHPEVRRIGLQRLDAALIKLDYFGPAVIR